MARRRTMLRWASGIMMALGVGHLVVVTITAGGVMAGWLERGLWAAVPMTSSSGASTEVLITKVAFWAGPASFSVPLVLLGVLIWQLAGRDAPVSRAIGWGLAGWCTLGGILLVPSPFFVGAIAGLLVALAPKAEA